MTWDSDKTAHATSADKQAHATSGKKGGADKELHATVSRLNAAYSSGQRNMAPPVESAYTAPAECYMGVDPYAALKDSGLPGYGK